MNARLNLTPKRETFGIPPHGKAVVRCEYFPECQCGDDCVERRDTRILGWLFALFIAGTVAVGAGLIFVGVRS